MKIYLKFDANTALKSFLTYHLKELSLPFYVTSSQEVVFEKELSLNEKEKIKELLAPFKIDITNDEKLDVVQRIKIIIDEMLKDEAAARMNASDYLSDKLNYSYAYLSNLFSESNHTSIENYIILRKVDVVKELLLNSNLTLTEIAYRLNYSSVAHLSGQFKKVTGLTTSTFKRIVEKRNQ
ncbi:MULTISPECIES: helix-turn-helix domain-containing protein [Tenacibaculum]|uniref:AraC family transcriptional regulator n=2 Tax=Tenacibaculum TaxID=104267 RepID=A0AAE9MQF2_9FLAO|nr:MULTISPECIES: AraC family transcriptional regulator [Tenacibaculum]GFD76098.1 hypothetical protein KUL113_55180 [Tenacibaculum sp. KUL113]GFD83924.1 hypothetical protein KUL118_67860 [Tenacibaculum sp. KUL118]GFD93848.1 hypothetical protein KUL154_25810 [Alteromonas sp. KUL154]GFE03432.1 hypothetical protein KUL156_60240 [Alteromonas sp. KUL156]AZJ31241.1 AraC family transcriptional regulator [Tenacibaculum mesophilum]